MDKPNPPSRPRPAFAPKGRVIRATEMQAWNDGDGFIAAAHAEAERILAEARQEGGRLIDEARREAERAAIATVTERVADATRRLDRLVQHSEYWLAELVVETVERMLGSMDKRKASLAAAITALREFRHARRIVLRVSPAAADWIEKGLDQDLEPAMRALVVIQPDPHIREGRCVVATEFGTVEAGLDEQLAALRAGLRAQSEEEKADA